MDEISGWFSEFGGALSRALDQIVAYLPSLFGAVLLLLVGWIAASLVKRLVTKLGDGLNRVADRYLRVRGLARFRLSARSLAVIGQVVFWIIMLAFVTAATEAARLETFSSWLDRIIAYIPTLLAGGLIVFVGYLISAFMRDVVSATAATAGIAHSHFLGTVAQGITLIAAVIIGAEQIGLDVSFLVTVTAIILGAGLAALSLAFGLGAQSFVSNLIGAHYVQDHLKPGQRARIGEREGEVLEITATSIVLATRDGRASIPARAFNEETTVVLIPEGDDE